MKKNLPKKSGFTLIELLVVVAILSILSVIGLTLFINAQKGTRDSRRKADIESISKALEVNYNNAACGATQTNSYCPLNSFTAPILFSSGSIPSNPYPGGSTYIFSPAGIITDAQLTYTVCAQLETSTGNYNDAGTSANSTNTGTYYCIKNQE